MSTTRPRDYNRIPAIEALAKQYGDDFGCKLYKLYTCGPCTDSYKIMIDAASRSGLDRDASVVALLERKAAFHKQQHVYVVRGPPKNQTGARFTEAVARKKVNEARYLASLNQ